MRKHSRGHSYRLNVEAWRALGKSWAVQHRAGDSGVEERSQATVSSALNNNFCVLFSVHLWRDDPAVTPLERKRCGTRRWMHHKLTSSWALRCNVSHLGVMWGVVNLCVRVCFFYRCEYGFTCLGWISVAMIRRRSALTSSTSTLLDVSAYTAS